MSRYRNRVEITGRVSDTAIEKRMPSGESVVELRVIVGRDDREGVDTLDIAAWKAPIKRKALSLKPEEWIKVKGVLRRRFWRAGTGIASRWQVEARELERV